MILEDTIYFDVMVIATFLVVYPMYVVFVYRWFDGSLPDSRPMAVETSGDDL